MADDPGAPGEEFSSEGGLYFSGDTPWGNRVATEKEDVQNMLIDACKLAIVEYHVDGFRFDATNTNYMDHGFLLRLAVELKGIKPDVLLVAENLPNQPDLNRQGFDGFAQWCDLFHDKIKALLREGPFGAETRCPDGPGRHVLLRGDPSPPTPTTSSTTPRATTRTAWPTRSTTRRRSTIRRPRTGKSGWACSRRWWRWASP